jgi:phage tail sheath gpL-like
MKKTAVIFVTALFAIVAPAAVMAAEHDQGSMPMDHGSMKMDHGGGMMAMGKLAHEEVVDGVKATFNIIDIKAKMKEMGMKETHHIMVVFTDAKSGSKLSEGVVNVKVVGPDKKEQVKELMSMEGGFGSDFTMPEKGKYGIMAKFKLRDGKVRSVKFRYTVK